MTSSASQTKSAEELMHAVDDQLSHVWMVRAFLKHSDEAVEDEELASVHRDLYDYMLALGPSFESKDALRYLKLATKKLRRLRRAIELFHEIQPEVSGHTNFVMANHSLRIAVAEIGHLLDRAAEWILASSKSEGADAEEETDEE